MCGLAAARQNLSARIHHAVQVLGYAYVRRVLINIFNTLWNFASDWYLLLVFGTRFFRITFGGSFCLSTNLNIPDPYLDNVDDLFITSEYLKFKSRIFINEIVFIVKHKIDYNCYNMYTNH